VGEINQVFGLLTEAGAIKFRRDSDQAMGGVRLLDVRRYGEALTEPGV
jgi:hypothetical protein